MKTNRFKRISWLRAIAYIIIAFLSLVIIMQIWEFADKLIFQPEEFTNLRLDKPFIRAYDDVFFYFHKDILNNNPAIYQQVQKNEFILKTISGIASAVLFMILVFQLKGFIGSVKEKAFFTKKYIKTVRNIAMLLLIWVLVDFILYQCIQFFIPLELVEDSINYSPINMEVIPSLMLSVNFSLLLAAFAFYVIYIVLRQGIELKEQADYTI